jgi:hypothetical protein
VGKSYVEFKGFGFWTRDRFLQCWLLTLLEEMEKIPAREWWQESLMEDWRVQSGIDGGVMAL